jgi:hypothetical protein
MNEPFFMASLAATAAAAAAAVAVGRDVVVVVSATASSGLHVPGHHGGVGPDGAAFKRDKANVGQALP